MAQIKFRKLISTQTGAGATSGAETAQFFNENFDVAKENLEAIWQILELMVASNNIEGIRIRPVQDPEDPDAILYNLFEYNLDGDLENGEWYPLQILFQNLVGDVYQNAQLKKILDGLTPLDRFIPVESQVAINTSAISQNTVNISKLQESEERQDTQLTALEEQAKQQAESLRTKANQVLEMFDVVAKGKDYIVGSTIMDQASSYVLNVDSVDSNGGVLAVSLSTDSEANSYYIIVTDGGADYKVGDIIPTNDPTCNGVVTQIDVNGSILKANITYDPVTSTLGRDAVLTVKNGSGAIVSTTTYPTIYFQCVNDGAHHKIIYYLNGDLTTPYDIIAYPDFVNIQKILDSTTNAYYELTYTADSEYAIGYKVGDTFSIDGTSYTGTITDVSTDPFVISCSIPATSATDLAGDYTTTSTSGTGTGLHINIGSIFHPQSTTNAEFNDYMDGHDRYLKDNIASAVAKAVADLTIEINKKANQSELDDHLADQSNPHAVTKDQIGLGNVDNTADLDKPISAAAQVEFNKLNYMFEHLKKMMAVSTKYYEYLKSIGEVDPYVLYSVSNLNSTFVTETTLDETNITSPYKVGEVLNINGTSWQITILDPTLSPMVYTDTIDDCTELDISGPYTTTSTNGTGAGIIINVASIEF